MNSISGRSAVCYIKVEALGSEMIYEVLQHQHPLWVDVVEGDGKVTTAVHAVMFPVLDILKMRTERHLLRTKPLGMHEMFLNKAANRVIYTNLSVTTHQCTLIHK